MHTVQDKRTGEQDGTIVVDGQHYRPGQLISVEDLPVRRSAHGWTL